jgi:type IV fimbrial biogenesis protein FimT
MDAHALRQPDVDTAKPRGFTLIELMVTIAIAAIFATLAAPSFRELIAKQRERTASSALVESLWVARSEALKRNVAVGFPYSSVANGWDVKVVGDATIPTLHTQDGFSALNSTTSTGANIQFTFNQYGRLASGGNVWVEIGSPIATSVKRCVTVSLTGRATAKDGACT